MSPTLIDRFARAGSSGYPSSWTQFDAIDFYHEGPRRQQALVRLAEQQIAENRKQSARIVEELRSTKSELSDVIAASIEEQTEILSQTIESGFDNINSKLEQVSDRICANLQEIIWGVQQLSSQIETLIYIAKHRRSVEAKELFDQATRHLIASNFGGAKDRLEKALDLDSTYFEALYSMGIVSLHFDDAKEAKRYFHLAAYVPNNLSSTAKAKALFSLARTNFISTEPDEAFKVMIECCQQDPCGRNYLYTSIYAYASKNLEAGDKSLRSAIEVDSTQFASAATHEELEFYRSRIIKILEDELSRTNKKFSRASENFKAMIGGWLGQYTKIVQDSKLLIQVEGIRTDIGRANDRHFTKLIDVIDTVAIFESIREACIKHLSLLESIKAKGMELNNVSIDLTSYKKKLDSSSKDLSSPKKILSYIGVGLIFHVGMYLHISSTGFGGAFSSFLQIPFPMLIFDMAVWPLELIFLVGGFMFTSGATPAVYKFGIVWYFVSILVVYSVIQVRSFLIGETINNFKNRVLELSSRINAIENEIAGFNFAVNEVSAKVEKEAAKGRYLNLNY